MPQAGIDPPSQNHAKSAKNGMVLEPKLSPARKTGFRTEITKTLLLKLYLPKKSDLFLGRNMNN